MVALLGEGKGVALGAYEDKSHRHVPQPSYATPRGCHQVEVVRCACRHQHPFLANGVKEVVLQFFYVYSFHCFVFVCGLHCAGMFPACVDSFCVQSYLFFATVSCGNLDLYREAGKFRRGQIGCGWRTALILPAFS